MAEAKKKRVRARNEDGTLKADDKSTPDINEAWVEETPAVETPSIVIYESREKEPKMFDCAGISSFRSEDGLRLQWRVQADDTTRFETHFHVISGRIVRKAI
tara:strand:- start:1146 stop:1451 length:306 start_codon:yes stop_codon:yes gene_type:complete